jgi:hypothetical protein
MAAPPRRPPGSGRRHHPRAARSGDAQEIIDNGLGEHPTVQIDSPFFETTDCGEWQKIG